MKANPDKCQLLVTSNALTFVNINGFQIINSTEKKLLGIKLDSKLSFESHVSSLCERASQKLYALTRTANYLSLFKQKALNYCPLDWTFHRRKLNYCINSIHERALRVTYQDFKSAFFELLQKDNSVTIHQRYLKVLATEI